MGAKAEKSWTKGTRREKSTYILEIGRRKTQVRLTFGKVVLGRHPKLCNIIFQAPLISRQHCGIVVTRDEITVEDLKSRNGTRVNGTLIQHCRLQPGDVITIGGISMTLVLDSLDGQPPQTTDDTDPNAASESEAHQVSQTPKGDAEDAQEMIPDEILNTMFDFDDD